MLVVSPNTAVAVLFLFSAVEEDEDDDNGDFGTRYLVIRELEDDGSAPVKPGEARPSTKYGWLHACRSRSNSVSKVA